MKKAIFILVTAIAISFQKINGLARRKVTTEDTKILEFHIFDFAQFDDMMFLKNRRLDMLHKLFNEPGLETAIGDKLKLVELKKVRGTKEAVHAYYLEVLEQGYEGIMISDEMGIHKSGKTKIMWKFKPIYDAEFAFVRLVPAEEGRNLGTFAAIELRMEDGNTFTCSGITDEARKRLLKSPPPVGQAMIIEYGDLSEANVPIFPRCKDERWDQ